MQKLFSFRGLAFLGFLGCASGLLMAVFYFQKVLGLEPCPMCIFQRVAMIAAGVAFLVAAIHGPRGGAGQWAYAGLVVLAAGIGAFIAARHTWLQGLPEDQRPACGPTLDYLVDMMPLKEVVATVIRGDGNCAKIDWTLLGYSLPAWTFVVFACLILWALAMPILPRIFAKSSR